MIKYAAMTAIHPTAIVSPKAELAADVSVGPHAVIEEHVRVGAGTRILARAHLTGWTEIGKNNIVHMGAVLGHEPQDLGWKGGRSYLKIGDGNVIREYATIHRGTKEETSTVLGNNNFLMAMSHVAHNCQVGNHVILANGVLLAGYVVVEDRAFLSGNAVVQQNTRVGMASILSGVGAATKDVPPFMIVLNRSEVGGVNVVGMRRAGIGSASIRQIRNAHKLLFNSGLATKSALEKMEFGALGPISPELRYLLDFIKSSKLGICRPVLANRHRRVPSVQEPAAEEVL